MDRGKTLCPPPPLMSATPGVDCLHLFFAPHINPYPFTLLLTVYQAIQFAGPEEIHMQADRNHPPGVTFIMIFCKETMVLYISLKYTSPKNFYVCLLLYLSLYLCQLLVVLFCLYL